MNVSELVFFSSLRALHIVYIKYVGLDKNIS